MYLSKESTWKVGNKDFRNSTLSFNSIGCNTFDPIIVCDLSAPFLHCLLFLELVWMSKNDSRKNKTMPCHNKP